MQLFFINISKQLITGLLAVCFCISAKAGYIENFPITITQPDGKEVHCFATGDEFYNWVHDADGFTLIRDPQTGIVVYAKLENDVLVSTGYCVGSINPAKIGLQPWLNISPEKRLQRRSDYLKKITEMPVKNGYQKPKSGQNNGELNNLVIYIRFADEDEFPLGKGMKYEGYFNRDEPEQSSVYAYFKAVSNEKTFITSHFYNLSDNNEVVSYKDIYPRSYFQPYNATTNPGGYHDHQVAEREQELLKRAIDFVKDDIPQDLDLDFNNDGYVDNIAFIVSGFPGAWASLLWPHMWVMFWDDVFINGKQVGRYNFLIERHLDGSGPSVLAHEMAHTLGFPDLYRYAYNGEPVGKWDLMASNTTPPQSPTAWMKHRYGGWIENIPEITENGVFTLNNVWSETNNAYKIMSPNSTEGEFFVIEYRNRNVFWDKDLPGSGLIIYRINPTVGSEFWGGNADGPPDELYIYRAGGKSNMANDGGLGGAVFSKQSGRTNFNNVSNPSCFLSNDRPGGIAFYNVGASGEETMTFEVDFSLINTQLYVSPNTLTFRSVPIGTTSEPQTITVCGDDLAFDIKYETVDVHGEFFTVEEADDWNPATGGTLAVKFTPESNNIVTARLTVSSPGATSQTVTLKAQGANVAINDISTGLESIRIYPNPTTGEVRVTSNQLQVTDVGIFDVFGRTVGAHPCGRTEITTPPFWHPSNNGGEFTLDISNVPSGIFFVRIQTENGVIVRKVVKL